MENKLSLNQVTVSVTNIESSFAFYRQLGLYPIVKSTHYARFVVPGNETTFSIHLADKVNSTTTVYFEVTEVDVVVSELKKEGITLSQEPKNQPWEWREAYLLDPDGNEICIYQAGKVRINPDWRLSESKNQHLLTEAHFKNWLEDLKEAWETRSPEKAASLFSEDAAYHETPFDAPAVGKENILKYWQDVPRLQENITFNFELIRVYNNAGFCKWSTSFIRTQTKVKVELDGILEVTFNKDGKCSIFKEWWHRKETEASTLQQV